MEYEKTKNHKSSINSNDNNSKKEDDPSITSLLWEGIVNIFNPVGNKTQKTTQTNKSTNSKIKYQYCNCPITHSKEYCDNIYYLIKMIKNDIDPKKGKIMYENLLKINENSLDNNGENIRQIKKDLGRTFPSSTPFKDDRIFLKLKNVLRAFSNYDNSIKYFQGMNFIVGFFLYHCDEYIAFWLFVALLEEYDLRPIFMTNFPGFNLHVKRIEIILQKE